MPEVTARRLGELQRGAFRVLIDHADGLPAKEVIEHTKTLVHLLTSRRSITQTTLVWSGAVRFATIAPVKAGWMIKDKGKWYLTEEGKQAYNKYQDPLEFRREN